MVTGMDPGNARKALTMLETADLAGTRRHALGLIRQATAGEASDPEAFAQVVNLMAELNAALTDAVPELLAQGYSWGDLGKALGKPRENVWRKYHPVCNCSPVWCETADHGKDRHCLDAACQAPHYAPLEGWHSASCPVLRAGQA